MVHTHSLIYAWNSELPLARRFELSRLESPKRPDPGLDLSVDRRHWTYRSSDFVCAFMLFIRAIGKRSADSTPPM